jgi:hypothetical protein
VPYEDLVCDFCATPKPTRKYLCAPFVMMTLLGVEHFSDNAWAACETCGEMVDADQWEDLAQRSVDTMPDLPRLLLSEKQEYLEMLRVVHQKFREAKGRVA